MDETKSWIAEYITENENLKDSELGTLKFTEIISKTDELPSLTYWFSNIEKPEQTNYIAFYEADSKKLKALLVTDTKKLAYVTAENHAELQIADFVFKTFESRKIDNNYTGIYLISDTDSGKTDILLTKYLT